MIPPEPIAISPRPVHTPQTECAPSASVRLPHAYTTDSQRMVRYFPSRRSEMTAPTIGSAYTAATNRWKCALAAAAGAALNSGWCTYRARARYSVRIERMP